MTHHPARLLAGILLVFAVAAPSAFATQVNVRIEGPPSTAFDGWGNASPGRWHFSDSPSTTYQCNGVAGNSGSDVPNPTPTVTSGNAVLAVQDLGISMVGSCVGTYTVKAEKPGAMRSNGVTICIHNGNDGNCGYPLDPGQSPSAPPVESRSETPPPVAPITTPPADTKPPIATIAGLLNQERFARGKGPRELKGSISDSSTLKNVEVRLRRQTGKRCSAFDETRERFKTIRCSADAAWFSVGDKADWSYLLPSKLAKGLYQLQVRATDSAGNQSTVQSLRFRVA